MILQILASACFCAQFRFCLRVLLDERETLDRLLGSVCPLGIEEVPLSESGDRIMGQDLRATLSLPRFDNSTMDGYAIRSENAAPGARLRVTGEQPAGADLSLKVEDGCAIRIFTGAPIPGGADCVIMQEDVDRLGESILLKAKVSRGEFIRVRGEDLCEGQTVIARGEVITGPKLAAIASQGLNRVNVFRRPRVRIIATGSELRAPGESIQPGEIYETNRVLLADLTTRSGANAEICDIVPDTTEAHLHAFEHARSGDAIVIAGGVSVGEKDLVKPTLLELGAKLHLWRVAVKPGKPFLFGQWEETLVFGLPGNPVSAFVTFLLFVRPALWKLGGRVSLESPRFFARLEQELTNEGDRPHYLRGYHSQGTFKPVGRQESHALFGLSQANALCRLDPHQTVATRSIVKIIPV